MTIKPARISGQIPAGYKGSIFYRISNFKKRYPPSKLLADYLKYPGRNVFAVNKIVGLGERGAIADTSDFGDYLDKQGNVYEEWSKPIHAVTKANYRQNWPEFSPNRISFVSERLKNIVEKYEKENHAFVAVDVEAPDKKFLFRAFVMVGGNTIDAVDVDASKIVPSRVYPNGRIAWLYGSSANLPTDEFAYLHRDIVQGKHHFLDENLGHVWSQEIVAELGDVLPKEFVFVPMGVTG
jgi:hypothetical protein